MRPSSRLVWSATIIDSLVLRREEWWIYLISIILESNSTPIWNAFVLRCDLIQSRLTMSLGLQSNSTATIIASLVLRREEWWIYLISIILESNSTLIWNAFVLRCDLIQSRLTMSLGLQSNSNEFGLSTPISQSNFHSYRRCFNVITIFKQLSLSSASNCIELNYAFVFGESTTTLKLFKGKNSHVEKNCELSIRQKELSQS